MPIHWYMHHALWAKSMPYFPWDMSLSLWISTTFAIVFTALCSGFILEKWKRVDRRKLWINDKNINDNWKNFIIYPFNCWILTVYWIYFMFYSCYNILPGVPFVSITWVTWPPLLPSGTGGIIANRRSQNETCLLKRLNDALFCNFLSLAFLECDNHTLSQI